MNQIDHAYLMTKISMAGRLVSMRTITEAMEKLKTERKATRSPKAGMRSARKQRDTLLSIDVADDVKAIGFLASAIETIGADDMIIGGEGDRLV